MRTWLVGAAVALVVSVACPLAAPAWTTQGKQDLGPPVNASTWDRACYRYAGGDFSFSYTDSVYTPLNQLRVFLFLSVAEPEPDAFAYTLEMRTQWRGLVAQTPPTPPVRECQGGTTATAFAVKTEWTAWQKASVPFHAIT